MRFFAALFCILCISISSGFAQHFSPALTDTLHSEVLNEDREIWISLPKGYNNSAISPARYPVMVLLDAEFYFQTTVAVRDALSGRMYTYMPEMIIVGIKNTDRSRDLTPTNDSIIHAGQHIHQSSGGAANFAAFLSDELLPYIHTNYRTNGYRILNGHSFGGLFTTYMLVENSQTFNAYIVHDPSLWWDDKALSNQALKKLKQTNLKGRSLYFSMANDKDAGTDRFKHSASIRAFHEDDLNPLPE